MPLRRFGVIEENSANQVTEPGTKCHRIGQLVPHFGTLDTQNCDLRSGIHTVESVIGGNMSPLEPDNYSVRVAGWSLLPVKLGEELFG